MKAWVKYGLIWALFMTIYMAFVSPYLMVWLGFDKIPEKQPPLKIAIFVVMFIIGGLVSSYYSYNRKKIKKQIDS